MKIYLELDKAEQSLILALTPQNYSLAIKVREEKARLKKIEEAKLTSEKLKRDVRIFLTEEGGHIEYIKSREVPLKFKKHKGNRKQARAKKLIGSLTKAEKDTLLLKLTKELKDGQGVEK